jgi:hypothetical protein
MNIAITPGPYGQATIVVTDPAFDTKALIESAFTSRHVNVFDFEPDPTSDETQWPLGTWLGGFIADPRAGPSRSWCGVAFDIDRQGITFSVEMTYDDPYDALDHTTYPTTLSTQDLIDVANAIRTLIPARI